jgi:hypothetical protein
MKTPGPTQRISPHFKFAAAFLIGICLLLSSLVLPQSALADNVPDVGLTSFYTNADLQSQKVKTLTELGYEIAVPLNKSVFKDPSGINLGDGSFTVADLDFSTAIPSIPNTARRIAFQAPLPAPGQATRLYAVVAGKVVQDTCPIAVKETKIVFFDNEQASIDAASNIAKEGFLVYVTANKAVQEAATKQLISLNCQGDGNGIIVNGKTSAVSVDFSKIFQLLPENLQQPAKAGPFSYKPGSGSDAIYLVNARKVYPGDSAK